jgi:transcriptional regulator with PAS, ATPase and Fis domain
VEATGSVKRSDETETDQTQHQKGSATQAPLPGLVLIFACGRPRLIPILLSKGTIELGRDGMAALGFSDSRISRNHARVTFDGDRWAVEDIESRNGTYVDGALVRQRISGDALRIVRIGRIVFLLRKDIKSFENRAVEIRSGLVVGPTLRLTFDEIARAARAGDTLHLNGESGVGKELAARLFHTEGPGRRGPFVAVNCAAIPHGVAERLLFGAVRGAFSGAATDAEGYVQVANEGTLFLDEVAELDPAVQGKLLRAVETREVMALGASTPRPVDLRLCSATHRSLRAEVAAGRFREDLFFRIGRPEVRVPPLRERLEEMPWLIVNEVSRVDAGLVPHISFIEACLARPWPGNVRELLTEVRTAARGAVAAGRKDVLVEDLASGAGQASDALPSASRVGGSATPSREKIEEALRVAQGNISQAARTLGVHRTQLRRWMIRHGLDPRQFGANQAIDEEEPRE